MAIQLKIENKVEVERNISAMPFAIERAVEIGVRDATIFLEGEVVVESPIDTGRLRKSINWKAAGFRGIVTIAANYAKFVHDGTGSYEIKPRRRKVLAFKKGGKMIFARRVKHPGIKANPFLKRAFENNEKKATNIIERKISQALKKTETK